jgi:hypothetical protein
MAQTTYAHMNKQIKKLYTDIFRIKKHNVFNLILKRFSMNKNYIERV